MNFANKQAAVEHLSKLVGMARSRGVSAKNIAKALGGAGITGFSSLTMAAAGDPVDFSSLTSNIDFSTVVIAILAIAGLMATVYVAWKGAKMVIAALRGL